MNSPSLVRMRAWPIGSLALAVVASLAGSALVALPARAVIIIGSSAGNTSAPTDAGLAERWDQVGNFNSFLGTPIAPQFFVTAKHIGNFTGQAITFPDSTSYTTTARFLDPASDLAIYQISGTFPNDKIVPMYGGSFSTNQAMTIFGRGRPRTDTAVVGQRFPNGTENKGWTWGTATGARSWGTNTFDGLADGGAAGPQLSYDFDVGGGNDQGVLSIGDSGGPVLMQEGGVWKLAGVNFGVEAIYNTTGSGNGFYAAIYDKGGLYSSSFLSGPWTYTNPTAQDQPARSFSTSIPDRATWISSVIVVPEPTSLALAGAAGVAALVFGLRRNT